MQGKQHTPDWIGASTMLYEALEQYRHQQHYASLPRVVDEIIKYIEQQSDTWLSEKTIKRDYGNRPESKKLHSIPDWRIKIYARWLYEQVGKDQEWLTKWLEYTAYSSPGNLLAEIQEQGGNILNVYRAVKTNVPPLKSRLWGRFLGRHAEMKKLRQWADNQRHPVAVLYGFGGNGKTTIQQKVGEDFVYGVKCQLRWPYEGAVWLSALEYPRGQFCLTDVLRGIAETFELYGHCTQEDLGLIQPNTIKGDVQELLEKKRILILLDNLETVPQTNQIDILRFFNELRGYSQTLVSTRYRPDWFLEQVSDGMYGMAHVLVQVDGLSSEDAQLLVQDFLAAKSLAPDLFDRQELTQLIALTRNNPKAILALLGLLEQGISLLHLLRAMSTGAVEAAEVYDRVIDRAWEELLTDADKSVLMAKSLFGQSVEDVHLGEVAGVDEQLLRAAIKRLAAISFFEFDREPQRKLRIRTHPLAQDFTHRVLHQHPQFEVEAEKRWWKTYAVNVVRDVRQMVYESLRPEQEDDVANVVERVEEHLCQHSVYALQAANMFCEPGGLGQILFWWGRYDDVLRLAKMVPDLAIAQHSPKLLGDSSLNLMALIHAKRRNFDEADRYIGLCLEQNITFQDPWLGALIDATRGFIYRRRGYLGAAEQSYQNALKLFLECGSPYDIADMYRLLGYTTLELACKDLNMPTDENGELENALALADSYFSRAVAYFDQEDADWICRYKLIFQRMSCAVTARLRGNLDEARNLLQSCIGQVQSLFAVAELHCELALVEHLAGNRELALMYDEKSISISEQLGMTHILSSRHSFKIIQQMKQQGTW